MLVNSQQSETSSLKEADYSYELCLLFIFHFLYAFKKENKIRINNQVIWDIKVIKVIKFPKVVQ